MFHFSCFRQVADLKLRALTKLNQRKMKHIRSKGYYTLLTLMCRLASSLSHDQRSCPSDIYIATSHMDDCAIYMAASATAATHREKSERERDHHTHNHISPLYITLLHFLHALRPRRCKRAPSMSASQSVGPVTSLPSLGTSSAARGDAMLTSNCDGSGSGSGLGSGGIARRRSSSSSKSTI